MWFQLGVQNFIAKKTDNGDSCDIFLSDFMRIWHKSLSNNELVSISQELNPLLEASVQRLRDITMGLLEDNQAHKEVREECSNIILKLKSTVLGVRFKFHVLLSQGDVEMFYKEFTMPLLHTLINAQNREKKLVKIIKDKDAEIKDYKQEYGARLKYLETKPFNMNEFSSQDLNSSFSMDPIPFLQCVSTKLQSQVSVPMLKQKEEIEDESKKLNSSHKCDALFKDKSLNQTNGSRPCMFLESQTVKKIKKHNEGFKIKL